MTAWTLHIVYRSGGQRTTASFLAPSARAAHRLCRKMYPSWTVLSVEPARAS